MLKTITRRAMTLLLSLAMIITYMPVSMMTAYAAAGDIPPHTKNLTDNQDGTYTLSLDVVGDSERVPHHVNVLVILDNSNSMGNTPERIRGARNAVNNLANSLFAYNTSDPNNVEMALVTFGTSATVAQGPTNSYNTFSTAVNATAGNGGGTNWEASFNTGGTVSFGDTDPTFVIFVSDGAPTFRTTQNGWNDWSQRYQQYGTGQEEEPNITRCYTTAVPAATTLAQSVGVNNFYTIFAYGAATGATRLQNLTTATGAPAGNYFNAANTSDLQAALTQILAQIETAGIGNVEIDDGTTNQVTTSSGDIAELLEVDESSYKYYRSGGTYGNMQPWSDAPEAELVNGAVEWDLSEEGVLEDGVRYTVTFDVYPSQYTYDTIAKLKNGDITYASLDSEIKKYIVDNGNNDYSLRTNTNAKLSYDDTRDDAGQQEVGYTNPDPVSTDADSLPIKKEWVGADPDVESLPITVMMGNEEFHTATLNAANDWETSSYISLGIIKNGQALPGALGHDFSFAELDETQYRWELDAPTVRPMLVNGVRTMLIKVDDDHPLPSGATAYTIEGNQYYANTAEGGLTATNFRRSNLNLLKIVTGEDAPEDATFPFTLTVNNSMAPEAEPADDPEHNSDYWVWFSIYDTTAGATVMDATVSGATGPNSTGYYYAPSGSAISVEMKDGWNLRFTNVPSGTTYTFAEGTLAEGFAFNKAELTEGVDSTFRPGQTTTGTIEKTQTSYQVEYTNDYTLTDLEITKVWVDNQDQDGIRLTPAQLAEKLTLSPTVEGATPTIEDNGDDTYTITYKDLPRYRNGQEVEYTVAESAIDGYTTTGSPAKDHGTITNTHTPEVIDVTVIKVWDDDNNRDGVRPGSVTVHLLAGQTVVGDPVELNEDNDWTHTWRGVDKNSNKTPIDYTVSEDPVSSYTTQIVPTKNEQTGNWEVTVTNSHVFEKTNYSIVKVWNDSNDKDGLRPDSITVQLYKTVNGTKTAVEGKTATLTDDNLRVDWDDLPKYENGALITYSGDETEVPTGYTKSIDETSNEKTTVITNTHGSLKTTYTVVKIWDDNNDQDGIRPESIEAQLFADGEPYGDPVELNEDNEWTYTWEDLELNQDVEAKMSNENGEQESADASDDQSDKKADNSAEKAAAENTEAAEKAEAAEAAKKTAAEKAEAAEAAKKTAAEKAEAAEQAEAAVEDAEDADAAMEAAEKAKAEAAEAEEAAEKAEAEAKEAAEAAEKAEAEAKEAAEAAEKTEAAAEAAETKEADKAADTKAPALRSSVTPKPIKYTADETAVPTGYTKSGPVHSETENKSTVTNIHTPETTSATVKKVWDDAENQDGKRPPSLDVTLSNGTTVTLNADNEWTATVENLPKYNNGVEIVYTWTEDEEGLPDGYELTNTSKNGTITTFTNSYTPKVTSVKATKTWLDNNNQDGKRPDNATVQLYKQVGTAAKVAVGDPVTVPARDGEINLWNNLPVYEGGVKIVYSVEETLPADSGYTKSGDDATITADEVELSGTIDISNSYTPEKTNITVEKIWDDNNDQDGKRNDVVAIAVLSKKIGETVTEVERIAIAATDGWSHTWDNLPVYEGGQKVTYLVKEILENANGYVGDIVTDTEVPNGGKQTITNSYTPKVTSVKATKTWNDANNQDGKRPTTATVQLYKKVGTADKEAVGDPVTVPATNGDINLWENLPVYEGGVKIVYSVEETLPADSEYTKSGDDVTVTADEVELSGTIAITNSYTPEKTKIDATKTWSDNNNQDGKRPDNATVQLYKTVGETKTAVGDPVTVPKAGGDIHEWTDLPVYEGGVKIKYSIEETLPEGSEYSKTGDGALIEAVSPNTGTVAITNSYTPEATKVTATKTWSDNNDQDGKRPDNATVQLYKKVGTADKVAVGDPVTVPKAGGTINEWTGLPVYENGTQIIYSVEETLPTQAVTDGYTKSGDDVTLPAVVGDSGTVAITNSYTPEKTKIDATKTWSDNNNQDGKRPADATVQLYKTVGETKTAVGDPVTVPKAGGAIHEWTDLPVYEGGVKIKYSVEETLPTDSEYTKSGDGELIEAVSPNTGTVAITNSYTPEKTKIDATKTWDDADNQDGKRPADATVQLYKTVGETKTAVGDPVTVPEAGGAIHEWTDLPVYEDGVKIKYSVEETLPADSEYTKSGDGALLEAVSPNTGTVAITNSYTPKVTSVKATKTWNDANNQDGKRPADATVQLYKKVGSADKVAVGDPVTVPATDGDINLWENLPVYEGGVKIVYSVEETLPADSEYTKSGDDVTVTADEVELSGIIAITNSYTPEETRRTVIKVWDDAENQDGKRPTSLVVTLAGDGTAVGSVTLSDTNNWTDTIDELPVYANGTKISYVWTEGELPEGYTLTNTEERPELDEEGVEIGTITTLTNSHIPELTEAHVTKVWNDNNDKDGIRPSNVYVQLYADGVALGNTIALNEANEWHHDWSNLDKYKDGNLIAYTVDENPVPEGYTKEVTQVVGQTNAYIVTNSHQSEPDKDVFSGESTTSIDGKVVKPGDELTYTIEFVNTNPTSTEKAKKVEITDDIPAHTTYVADSATSTIDGEESVKGTVSGNTITWTFESEEGFESDTKFVATFKVTVDPDKEPLIENTGRVRVGENDYDTNVVRNSKPVKDVFEEGKTETSIDGKMVKAGDILTYQIKYTNVSKDKVEQIDITDEIPEHTKYVADSAKSTVNGEAGPDGTESGGTITWTFTGDAETGIAAGTEFVVTFDVEVLDDAGDIIENEAKVQEGENTYDTNIVTNSKPVKDVFAEGDTTTSIDGKVVKPGDVLTYQVKYTNKSKEFVEQIVVTDTIPEHTKYVADSAKSTVGGEAGPDGAESGGTITWTIPGDPDKGIPEGTEVVVTFNVEVLDDQGTVIENQAKVNDGKNSSDTNIVTNSKPVKDVFEEGKMTTSIDGKVVKPGDVLTYQVKYTNTSKELVEQIDITDEIPEHTKYVDGTAKSTVNGEAGPDGTESGGTITWTFTGDADTGIAAGTEFVVTFNVEVLDDQGTVIENQAKVQEGENTYDTNIVTNSKPVKDVFEEGSMTTSIDGKIVKPGDVLTYQIKYTNTSKEKVEQIDITDKIPEHTKYVAGSAKSTVAGEAGPDGTESGGTITWSVKDSNGIKAGTEIVATFNVEVVEDYGELIKNKAQVQEGENTYDTNEVVNSKPVKDVFEEGKMTTSIDGKVVKPGDILTYEVKYTNVSKEKVEQIDITDKIPEHTKYVDGTAKSKVDGADGPDGTESGGTITWTFTGDADTGIATGTQFVVTFNVEVLDDQGTVIENQANVNDGKNSSDTNIVINSKPVKDVFEEGKTDISIDGKLVQPGDVLTYQVRYTNTSKDKVEKIEIKDKIPSHTEYVAGSAKSTVGGAAGPNGAESGGTITWTFENASGFPVRTEFVATFDVKVLDDKGTAIENEAQVIDGNNTYETNDVVNSKPVKEVYEANSTTSIDGKVVDPGQELTYSITYKNATGGVVDTVTITDKIPQFTTYVDGTAKSTLNGSPNNDGTFAGGVITWTIENVPKDGVVVATFNVKVDPNTYGESIKNTAEVREGENEPKKTNEVSNFTPVKHDPPVLKELTGDEPDEDETFLFQLKAISNTAGVENPMPAGASGKTFTIETGVGVQKEFGDIIFRAPGEYYYEVSEVDTGLEGYKYDTTVYKLHYTITLVDGELKMQLTTTKNGNPVRDTVYTFVNEYESPEEPPEKPDTGDHNSLGGWLALMLLAGAGGTGLYARRRREDQ